MAKKAQDSADGWTLASKIAGLAMIGTLAAAVFSGWDRLAPAKPAPSAPASSSQSTGPTAASAVTNGNCSPVMQGVQVQGGLAIQCGPTPPAASAARQ